jgi:hypothetical protein
MDDIKYLKMTQSISKKQFTINQKRVKMERRQSKRERESSRNGHAAGYKPYRETSAAKFTGYRVVKQELPWIGVADKTTGKLGPFKGINQREARDPFYIHPVSHVPIWYVTSPPSTVAAVRYVYESTRPLAGISHCA